jgi:YD repeat-containing protein
LSLAIPGEKQVAIIPRTATAIRCVLAPPPYSNTISPTSNRLDATSGPRPAKRNSYDAAGNLKTDGTVSYAYGVSGRMDSATVGGKTTSYRYNGLGQRVMKSFIGRSNYYVYDEGGRLIGEYGDQGEPIQEINSSLVLGA